MSRPLWKTPAFLVAVALLLLTAGGLSAVVKIMGLNLTKLAIQPEDNLQLTSIPAKLPGWEQAGQDVQLSKEESDELGTANTISRTYVETGVAGGQPRIIQLHLAYYTGMIDTVPHVPDRCLTAHGTKLDGEKKVVPVPVDTTGFYADPDADKAKPVVYRVRPEWASKAVRLPRGIEKLSMTVSPFVDNNGRRFFAGYFFVANGGTVASADGVRLLAFKLQDDYAYYLKVQFTSASVKSEEELGELSGRFLNVLLPHLMRCVPDWVDVENGLYPPDADRAPRARAGTKADSAPITNESTPH